MPRKGVSAFAEDMQNDMLEEEQQELDSTINYYNTNIHSDQVANAEFQEEKSFADKTGEFFMDVLSLPDKLDKAVGIYGARQEAIKFFTGGLSEKHVLASLAGEMLVPDTIDLVTLGLGYIPRRVLLKGPKMVKAFLKSRASKLPKFARKGSDAVLPGTKFASDDDVAKMIARAQDEAKLEAIEAEKVLKAQGKTIPTAEDITTELGTSGKRQFATQNPNTPGLIPLVRGSKGKSILNSKKGIFANLSNNTIVLGEQIIDELDKFHELGLQGKVRNWSFNRPTFQYKGKRRLPYIKPDGTPGELYFNWSKSQQTYVPRDIDSMLAAKAKRAKWNITSGGKNKAVRDIYKTARAANEALIKHLKKLLDDDPVRAQKILGGTDDQIIYIEHIHAQKSPFWNKPRPFKPRDTENLLIIEDDIFPKVKTAIEKQLYSSDRYKNVYIDMTRDKSYDMILRDARNDNYIGTIPGMTNKSQVKASIYRALTKKDPLSIEDIDPAIRNYLDEMHGITRETAQRLPDAKAGKYGEVAQNPYEALNMEIENISTRISDIMSGDAPMINAQAMKNLRKQLSDLEKQRDQLRLFSTSGDKTGLRIAQQKIQIAKPKRVKRRVDEGQIDPKLQIPEEFRGDKYGKPKK